MDNNKLINLHIFIRIDKLFKNSYKIEDVIK